MVAITEPPPPARLFRLDRLDEEAAELTVALDATTLSCCWPGCRQDAAALLFRPRSRLEPAGGARRRAVLRGEIGDVRSRVQRPAGRRDQQLVPAEAATWRGTFKNLW